MPHSAFVAILDVRRDDREVALIPGAIVRFTLFVTVFVGDDSRSNRKLMGMSISAAITATMHATRTNVYTEAA